MEISAVFGKKDAYNLTYNKVKYKNDILSFVYREALPLLRRAVLNLISKHPGYAFKIQFALQVELVKFSGEQATYLRPWFKSESVATVVGGDLDQTIMQELNSILRRYDEFVALGSGFTFEKIVELNMSAAKFIPFSGGDAKCPSLPREIRQKGACLQLWGNIESDHCFLYALAATLCGRTHSGRVSSGESRMVDECWDRGNLTFPTPLGQIPLFEKRNCLAICVFGWLSESVRKKLDVRHPPQLRILYLSRQVELAGKSRTVDLLYYKHHFYAIKDLSRLLYRGARSMPFVCRSCLTAYASDATFCAHRRICRATQPRLVLPGRDNKLYFKKIGALIPDQFVVYFDTESLLERVNDSRKTKQSYITQQHSPIAISAIRVCAENHEYDSELFTCVSTDCVGHFLDWLVIQQEEIEYIRRHMVKPVHMTSQDWFNFHSQLRCQLCGVEFEKPGVQRTLDHHHLTGTYRMALCNRCNLTYASYERILTVVSHNSSKYDLPLLLPELAKRSKISGKHLKTVPRSREQFLSLEYAGLRFIDSYQFLSSSLRKLCESQNLESKFDSELSFPLVFKFLCAGSRKTYELLQKKGFYPYSYMCAPQRMTERELPPRKCFFNDLKNEHISKSDYRHAQTVWRHFNCQTLGDYTKLYVALDTLLLADCFETFRAVTYREHNLEALCFLSLPDLAFQQMLKHSGVRLELPTDLEQLCFLKSAIRGGVATIPKRYAVANRPELDNYDPDKERSYVLGFDCVNLYGGCLAKNLPIGGFRWLSTVERRDFDLMETSAYGQLGYFVECTLSYPDDTHRYFSDFPPLSSHQSIPPSMWSEYQHGLASKLGHIFSARPEKRLVQTLYDHPAIICHYEALKVYIGLGVRLEKIHRILEFKQARFMADYIEYNSLKRKQAKSDFLKSYFKLSNNAIYGKSLTRRDRFLNLRLVTSSARFQQLVRKPNFRGFTIYSPELAAVEMAPICIEQTTPLYIGLTTLELAKKHMALIHYNLFVKNFPGIKLLLTDTDSLVYEFPGQDPQPAILANSQYFDLSNYPRDSPYFNETNAKRMGSIKVENPDKIIEAFAGCRVKAYSFKYQTSSIQKAKGIPSHIVQNLKFAEYRRALRIAQEKDPTPHTVSFSSIRRKKQKLYTIRQTKAGLNALDTKRFILPDGVNTLPYGHWLVREGIVK